MDLYLCRAHENSSPLPAAHAEVFENVLPLLPKSGVPLRPKAFSEAIRSNLASGSQR
jgi:hypothetical protein